jgi:hypothetical protein
VGESMMVEMLRAGFGNTETLLAARSAKTAVAAGVAWLAIGASQSGRLEDRELLGMYMDWTGMHRIRGDTMRRLIDCCS